MSSPIKEAEFIIPEELEQKYEQTKIDEENKITSQVNNAVHRINAVLARDEWGCSVKLNNITHDVWDRLQPKIQKTFVCSMKVGDGIGDMTVTIQSPRPPKQ